MARAVVCFAMLALTTLGINYFYGLALGTAIGVALTVAAAARVVEGPVGSQTVVVVGAAPVSCRV